MEVFVTIKRPKLIELIIKLKEERTLVKIYQKKVSKI